MPATSEPALGSVMASEQRFCPVTMSCGTRRGSAALRVPRAGCGGGVGRGWGGGGEGVGRGWGGGGEGVGRGWGGGGEGVGRGTYENESNIVS